MAYELDTERLRRDLEDDYGTAMSSGFPMAMMEMSEVERASDRELIEMAREKQMDLSKYIDQQVDEINEPAVFILFRNNCKRRVNQGM